MIRPPTIIVRTTSAAIFSDRIARAPPGVRNRRRTNVRREDDGHQHEDDHREEILDDEPAHRDVPDRCVEIVMVGQHADEDDGARDRQRETKDHARLQSQPTARAASAPSAGRDQALHERARHGDAADGQQLPEMKLQADAEHQEDDADFGELLAIARSAENPGV